jgi:hypothetical protein
MITLLIIILILLIIANVLCFLTARSVKKTLNYYKRKPSAKLVKISREYREMLDYKLSPDYEKVKSC